MPAIRYLVSNVDRAVKHYTQHLDFTLERQMGSAIAEVSRGGVSLYLSGPESSAGQPLSDGSTPQPGGWNRMLVEVDDLSARIDDLKAAGVPLRGDVVSGPGGKKILTEDPDGNLIELFELAES